MEQILFDDGYEMTFVSLLQIQPLADGNGFNIEIIFTPAQVTLTDTQTFY